MKSSPWPGIPCASYRRPCRCTTAPVEHLRRTPRLRRPGRRDLRGRLPRIGSATDGRRQRRQALRRPGEPRSCPKPADSTSLPPAARRCPPHGRCRDGWPVRAPSTALGRVARTETAAGHRRTDDVHAVVDPIGDQLLGRALARRAVARHRAVTVRALGEPARGRRRLHARHRLPRPCSGQGSRSRRRPRGRRSRSRPSWPSRCPRRWPDGRGRRS